jgi:hypothetical protein
MTLKEFLNDAQVKMAEEHLEDAEVVSLGTGQAPDGSFFNITIKVPAEEEDIDYIHRSLKVFYRKRKKPSNHLS